jgi:hypothetical protein
VQGFAGSPPHFWAVDNFHSWAPLGEIMTLGDGDLKKFVNLHIWAQKNFVTEAQQVVEIYKGHVRNAAQLIHAIVLMIACVDIIKLSSLGKFNWRACGGGLLTALTVLTALPLFYVCVWCRALRHKSQMAQI